MGVIIWKVDNKVAPIVSALNKQTSLAMQLQYHLASLLTVHLADCLLDILPLWARNSAISSK